MEAKKSSSARGNNGETENLCGEVEKIFFENQENGYNVILVRIDDGKSETVVGTSGSKLREGDRINACGTWHKNPKFGMQFKASSIIAETPTSKDGILRYLSSGIVRGVGPSLAKRIVDEFGEQAFDVFQTDPEQLLNVRGIGKKNLGKIVESYQEQRGAQDVMMFLQAHNVGAALAYRIYKRYKEDSIPTIQSNPYCLSQDIHGIGFKTADDIASEVGIAKDSPSRIYAGIFHAMQQFATHGHTAVERSDLIKEAQKLLSIDAGLIAPVIDSMGNIITFEQGPGKDLVSLKYLHAAEKGVAKNLKRIMSFAAPPWAGMSAGPALHDAQEKTGTQLAKSQCDAVMTALNSKFSIITGGPGVGKTTILNTMLNVLDNWDSLDIVLCAPTGRAAKRMSESTGRKAATIHRTLEYNPITNSFGFNADNKLDADLIVVDEGSMPDVMLTNALLSAVPDNSCVVILGDIDQLPSVGPGSVLKDMIASEKVPVVRLTEIFRQAKDSKIIVNAHRINHGEMPIVAAKGEQTDFYALKKNSPEEVLESTLQYVTQSIPQELGFDPVDDIQVLVPMHKGPLGTQNLNERLQQILNPLEGDKKSFTRFKSTYIEGDKVMQTSNDYEKDVFNGDVGRIQSIDAEDGSVVIDFDGRKIEYEMADMDSIVLAYATTIHKSQGSEYPCVVMPLVNGHHVMLERNLLYTGVTRGKQMVVVNSEPKALQRAVGNVTSRERQTLLQERIREELHDFVVRECEEDDLQEMCAPRM